MFIAWFQFASMFPFLKWKLLCLCSLSSTSSHIDIFSCTFILVSRHKILRLWPSLWYAREDWTAAVTSFDLYLPIN